MIMPPRSSRRPVTIIVAVTTVLLIVLYHSRLQSQHPPTVIFKSPQSPKDGAYRANPVSPALAQFWSDTLDALLNAKPDAPRINRETKPEAADMDPTKLVDGEAPKERKEHIHLSSHDMGKLKRSHRQFVESARRLAPEIPYKKKSKGIVMTAGGKYIGNAVLSLLMLRRTGSNLPVQLFLDSSDDFNNELCESTLMELNVECRSMQDVWKTTPSMPKLEKFQFKVFAILFSTFEHVMFLDADCFPIHNPDHFFDVEPYKSTGMVTWPDLWLSTSSPSFYVISESEAPPIELRRTSESGVMLIRRSKQADSLLLATYYNFYGPDYYYPLLSQGAHGEGDKETFLHGAMVLGNPYYAVRSPIEFLGRWINESFDTAGMRQSDPMEDFALRGGDPSSKGAALTRPDDLKAKTFFIHHNLVKLDMNRLGESMEPALRRNKDGKLDRLWGDCKDLRDQAGYDVEKAMWEEIIRVDCHQSFLADCSTVRKYYQAIFGTG